MLLSLLFGSAFRAQLNVCILGTCPGFRVVRWALAKVQVAIRPFKGTLKVRAKRLLVSPSGKMHFPGMDSIEEDFDPED